MYLVTADEMRQIDIQTTESFGLPSRILMENAGRGASEVLLQRFVDIKQTKIAIAAGKGNNGGDGFVMARYLAEKSLPVRVYLLTKRDAITGDAAANLYLLQKLNIPVIEILDKRDMNKYKIEMRHQTLWVDAILGTGLTSNVRGIYRDFIEFLNNSGKPILSVDIPSGLNADTGQPCDICVQAHITVTFGFAKCGHHLYPGVTYTGPLEVIDIGIPQYVADKTEPKQYLLSSDMIGDYWINRAPDAHKGTTGHLLVIAGSTGKTGAAVMTTIAAMRIGSGLVTLGIPRSLNPTLEVQILEAMTCPLPETVNGQLDESSFDIIMDLLIDKKCLAIGPGIGMGDGTYHLFGRIIKESSCPVIIDADGLNHLSGQKDLLKSLKVPVILTPHPGEMSKLTGRSVKDIQKDRIGCARSFAQAYHAYIVLKGARTIIAHPDGSVYINPTGNSGMASGGMGDVLTGLIAGLVTQGYQPEPAIHMAVFLHGMAADTLAENLGPVGFLASDVMNRIPKEINRIMTHRL